MKPIKISAENAEFQIIFSLKANRVKRGKTREVFIEGTECIKQALAARMELTRILTVNPAALSDWAKQVIAAHPEARVCILSGELYNRLCDRTSPPELLATAGLPPVPEELPRYKNPFILVFDRPSDLGNLGTIIRSLNAFRGDALFIAGHGVDVYESKVIRASLGSVFHTRIVYLASAEALETYIREEKAENGMLVIGTDSAGRVSVAKKKYTRPVMVIIGNEAKGMSVKLKALCDEIVKIPVSGTENSLNVSNAASIIMWEIYKNTLFG